MEKFITIQDGTQFPVFPKTRTRKAKPTPTSKFDDLGTENYKLFYNNAFLFVHHWQQLFSDSRLFLTRVYLPCYELDYTYLGACLEWWRSCSESHTWDNGSMALLCGLAGSPFTGMNGCTFVTGSGRTFIKSISSFNSSRGQLIAITKRYKGAYQSYTIEEAISILQNAPIQDTPDQDFLSMIFDPKSTDNK